MVTLSDPEWDLKRLLVSIRLPVSIWLFSLNQVPLPKPREKTHLKETKKVTFVDGSTAAETQQVGVLRPLTGFVLTVNEKQQSFPF